MIQLAMALIMIPAEKVFVCIFRPKQGNDSVQCTL